MKGKGHIYKSEIDRDFELSKLEFEKSLALRNFEIDNFWKRAWFFGALILALAAAYSSVHEKADMRIYCIYISFFAFLVALIQSLINRGSKYWQERWEVKTKNKEKNLGIDVTFVTPEEAKVVNEYIYMNGGNLLTRPVRYSVTKLTFLVSDIITVFFLLIWIYDCGFINLFNWDKLLHFHNWSSSQSFFMNSWIFRPLAWGFHLVVFAFIFTFLFLEGNKLKFRFGKIGGGGKVYEFYQSSPKFEYLNDGGDDNKVIILISFKPEQPGLEWEEDDIIELRGEEIIRTRNGTELSLPIPNNAQARFVFRGSFPKRKG